MEDQVEKEIENQIQEQVQTQENQVNQEKQVVENQEQIDEKKNQQEEKKKIIKYKVAFFFGYNGSNYHGLQFQKDIPQDKTVEGVIFKAFCDLNLIAPYHRADLNQCEWTRGARTDKGVHALVNGVSVRFDLHEDFVLKENINLEAEIPKNANEEIRKMKLALLMKKNVDKERIVKLVNSFLPADIRAHGMKLVSKGFCIRKKATSRLYQYCMPLFMYQAYKELEEGKKLTEQEEVNIVEKINKVCNKFLGSHNFHNYTVKISPKDDRAKRYIISMKADLIVPEGQGNKFVRFKLEGQSFVYHQIRKMMGSIVYIFQQNLNEDFLDNTFFNNRIHIWLAPAEGLFLDRMNFKTYNRRGDIPEPIDFDENETKRIEEFRKYLESTVQTVEEKTGVFKSWLKLRVELNSKGIEDDDNEQDVIVEED